MVEDRQNRLLRRVQGLVAVAIVIVILWPVSGVESGVEGSDGDDTLNGNAGYDFCQGGAGGDSYSECEDKPAGDN